MQLRDLKVGQRIELEPATDLWARGARYGEIKRIRTSGRRTRVHVRLDREPVRTFHLHPRDIARVV